MSRAMEEEIGGFVFIKISISFPLSQEENRQPRARICKLLRSPGSGKSITSGWESIPGLLKRCTNTGSVCITKTTEMFSAVKPCCLAIAVSATSAQPCKSNQSGVLNKTIKNFTKENGGVQAKPSNFHKRKLSWVLSKTK